AQVTTTLPATLPQTMRNTALAAGDQAQNDAYADTILHEPLDCHARVNGAGPEYTTVQAAVDAASAGDTVWIAGTCLGAFERAGLFQQVYVTRSLTLRGGYSTDFSAWNPDLYTTTLNAEGQGRVVYVTGPVNVAVETLRLTGGNANGLGGGFFWDDAGGGVYAITATVTLSGTHVAGNVASTDDSGFGGGVGVISATLTLVETTLAGNTASSAFFGLGYGGGLSAELSTVRLERSRLENNTASAGSLLPGIGGGAYFYGSDLEANATLWLSNTVFTSFDWGQGGGLYVDGTRPFTLTNCVLADNRAHQATGESGSGLWVDGAPGVLLHPTIARNQDGEGIMADDTATVAITNAIIAGHSVGIRVIDNSTVTVN
ncbi:MAG: right-handed parallel beta-helix repeat-containing protein, partial [Planctomycetes bacterium]|nr:right-handed parallel beta-helix repeat-containing protein [Planctomycetota bacterium]